MLQRFLSSVDRPASFFFRSRALHRSNWASTEMDREALLPKTRGHANFRVCSVSGHTTELLEIHADDPRFHVLLIPGNPGVITFYTDFVESLYELLGGSASVTAVGHISHTNKNWEHGRLFTLQEQINHKVDVIKQEFQQSEVPILLVGHSIGSYISIETFRRIPDKILFFIGLYPFLTLNTESSKQTIIGKIAGSSVLSTALSSIVALLGLLPVSALRVIVKQSLGKTWSANAVEAACSHLVKYHTIRNVLFMAMSEFKKLSEKPDWEFMRGKCDKIAFLFGVDDHWGPLQMFEEITKQAPDIALSIEKEGHTHAFCCTEAGSLWVAEHVASLIRMKNQDLK